MNSSCLYFFPSEKQHHKTAFGLLEGGGWGDGLNG